jgi:hypothetical protein
MVEKSKEKSNASHKFPPESNDYARIQTLAESSLSGGNKFGGKWISGRNRFAAGKGCFRRKKFRRKNGPKKTNGPLNFVS